MPRTTSATSCRTSSAPCATCARRLAEDGYPLDFDARPYGRPWTYHRLPGLGLRIELVDVSVQPEFLRTWNPDGPTMPPLNR
ncbi:hypothetical protein GCM10022224_045070 [Nonomuraea antimicrobica]|uniref:Uncharacterized protein n=1 Tax=Nonomuraea antimicrobica TaxID=561173 RepID=A0ABP7C3A0_9ACTN